jgi:hypothetical protein
MGKKRKYLPDQTAASKKSKLMFGHNRQLSPNMKGYLITYNCKFTFMLNEAKKLIQQFSISNKVLNIFVKAKTNNTTQYLLNLLNIKLESRHQPRIKAQALTWRSNCKRSSTSSTTRTER